MRLGGAGYPFAQGVEFGSAGRYRQFPSAGDSTFLYQAIWEKRPKVEDEYLQRLERVVEAAGFAVRG